MKSVIILGLLTSKISRSLKERLGQFNAEKSQKRQLRFLAKWLHLLTRTSLKLKMMIRNIIQMFLVKLINSLAMLSLSKMLFQNPPELLHLGFQKASQNRQNTKGNYLRSPRKIPPLKMLKITKTIKSISKEFSEKQKLTFTTSNLINMHVM